MIEETIFETNQKVIRSRSGMILRVVKNPKYKKVSFDEDTHKLEAAKDKQPEFMPCKCPYINPTILTDLRVGAIDGKPEQTQHLAYTFCDESCSLFSLKINGTFECLHK